MADLRVAIVGSGPAAFYAAGVLLASEDPKVEVDMIERLPTPWGLVRLGVAPDHPQLKTVSRAFEKIAARPGFRFFGNVQVGRDVAHDELASLYDAVVYAVGSLDGKTLHPLVQTIPVSTTPAPTSAPTSAPPTGGELPKTGSSTGLLVAIGLGSLVAGVMMTRRFATR